MRILRSRFGFQADHSSSSYLFYAVDRPVSAAGKKLAHSYSSRAEVDNRSVFYQKWGESDLAYGAEEKLLGEHYDVMASESYDRWTLVMAVPKTPEMEALLAPFDDDISEGGVTVDPARDRLLVRVGCTFEGDAPVFAEGEDTLDDLVDRLVKIRTEILKGDVSFLQAVQQYYGVEEDEESPEGADETEAPRWEREDLSKAELQQECTARGIDCRKSWTKAQLLDALKQGARGGRVAGRSAQPPARGKRKKLSKAAQEIVSSLSTP